MERVLKKARQVAIVGGGPAGLMAAEVLSAAGHAVTVFEAMPTVARKLLMAGKSGLNITHAEDYDIFLHRFGDTEQKLRVALDDFTPGALRHWAQGLGQETFVGTSGRVFPTVMKAAVAGMACPAGGARRCHQDAASLDGFFRRRAGFRDTGGRCLHEGRCRSSGARRRKLAASGFGCRMGAGTRG
jgi:choline dehydrogenase-like flavoprotein